MRFRTLYLSRTCRAPDIPLDIRILSRSRIKCLFRLHTASVEMVALLGLTQLLLIKHQMHEGFPITRGYLSWRGSQSAPVSAQCRDVPPFTSPSRTPVIELGPIRSKTHPYFLAHFVRKLQ